MERVSAVLSEPTPWRRVAVAASVFFVVVGLAAGVLWYVAGSSPPSGATAARPNQIVPDPDPGVDGGSSGADLPFPLQRQAVILPNDGGPGSIVVDRESDFTSSSRTRRRVATGSVFRPNVLKPASLFRIADKVELPGREASSPAVQAKR